MKACLACLLAALLPLTAAAEGLQYIPRWHMVNDEACYSFDDAKRLVILDDKLVTCDWQDKQYALTTEKLKLAVTDLESDLALTRHWRDLLADNNKKLEDQLREAIVAKAKAQQELQRTPPLWALIVGSVVLTGLGVGAGYLIFR